MATDPTARAKQWLGFVLLAGLTGIVLVAVAVELLFRRGAEDFGVWSGCLVLISVILVGPVGIRIVSKRSDPNDNGGGP